MSNFIVFPVLILLTSSSFVSIAQAAEHSTYVGDGRYVGKDRTSTDSAVLRQRNQEQFERRQDRDRSESRYQENQRQERAYERSESDRLY